ncbi:MAG: outer membrane beta-barrel domain-containing protein [Proteobacteria bacterium]|nr:outer membrane beta-barrel domain-containing protein [Pseudomonadota bacterium]
MKKRGFTLCITIFAVLSLFTSLSIAAERQGAFTLTPNIGGYFFEGDQNLEEGITTGINLGYSISKNVAVEGSFNYIDSELKNDNGTEVSGYLYKLDGLYNITSFGKLVPYLAAGVGAITIDPTNGTTDTDFLANYGAGLKYYLTDDIALRGDVRHVLPFGNSQNNLLCTAGLSFLFGGEKETPKADSDGDGVYDYLDKCPDTPKGVRVDKDGCPPDSDGDGVYDYLDKCPDTPKGVEVDENGCPLDTDGDGVYDYLDKCPDTPKDVKVDEDGCPLDTDGDGVYDYLDKCPDTPKGVKVDENGCPPEVCPQDTDGDGVFDPSDKCPNTPKAAKVDSRGCWVLEGVYFDTAKSNILPQSFPILDNVVAIIINNPGMKFEIQGHTDNRGSKTFNQKLSKNRAKAVLEYLVKKGVNRSKLTAKGFGSLVPASPNDTVEGMTKNRRVELKPIF